MRCNINGAATILALLGSSFLTACGGGGDGNGGGDSTPVAQTAAHCFDDARYMPGNKIEQDIAQIYVPYVQRRTYETSARPASFNGIGNLIEHSYLVSILDASVDLRKHTLYLKADTPNAYWNYGSIIEVFGENPQKSTNLLSEPFINRRASLKIGESWSYRVHGDLKCEPPPYTQKIDFTVMYTYLGDEELAVGNRKINACKFRIDNGGSEWVYKSLVIQQSSSDEKSIIERTVKLMLNGKDY
jgi:hypothetical protein